MADETTQAPKPAAAAAKAPAETTEQKVRRWMHESLANGPLARNTELWNVVDGALPALVDIIDAN